MMIPQALLSLSLEAWQRLPVACPAPGDAEAESWRDNDGNLCAVGREEDGKCVMHFPGLACYVFDGRSRSRAYCETGASEEDARETYFRCVLPFAAQAFGLEVIHASAVQTAAGVLAFCAVSGTGKSTVAYGLSRRGYPQWSDDSVAFVVKPEGIEAIPLPLFARLRAPVADFFARNDGQGERPQASSPMSMATHLLSTEQQEERAPAPLAALCLLHRAETLPESDAEVRITALPPAQAFTELLAHAYCFSLRNPERKRAMMRQYLALAQRVPAFSVTLRSGLGRLPDALTELERQLICAQKPYLRGSGAA